MNDVTVRQVHTRSDLSQFVDVAGGIYANDPTWVQPLTSEVRVRLSPRQNPYFQHATAAYFIAERSGKAVGRISAQICELAQHHQAAGTGHFGFFESDDCRETALALFAAAADWLKHRGMNRMVGPFNLSVNEEAGLLIDGFHRPPFIFMCHNPAYYAELFIAAGMLKEIDVYAYYLDISQPYPKRLERIMRSANRDQRIQLRNVSKLNLESELGILLELFNEAWGDNWGHIPMTTAEVNDLAMLIRRLFSADSVLLAEVDGECAGFIVAIPNLNELTADFRGRLFPLNWLKLLYRIRSNRCTSIRVPLMGIAQKYQNTRMGAAIAFSMIDRSRAVNVAKGVTHCEMSWILESNTAMRSILDASGSTLDKTYRLYSRPIG